LSTAFAHSERKSKVDPEESSVLPFGTIKGNHPCLRAKHAINKSWIQFKAVTVNAGQSLIRAKHRMTQDPFFDFDLVAIRLLKPGPKWVLKSCQSPPIGLFSLHFTRQASTFCKSPWAR
jgi:hypothetical protein